MSNYRRSFLKGCTFFFTVVTFKRYPIFEHESSIVLLRTCIKSTMIKYPFRIDAIVILPDHLHTIWTLPDGESDFSTRWKLIKSTFSHQYTGAKAEIDSASINRKHEKGIWQRRFWEHQIRDQEDFNRHCDYIYFNPVKHGMVVSPAEWEYSSFKSYAAKGFYPEDWAPDVKSILKEGDFE